VKGGQWVGLPWPPTTWRFRQGLNLRNLVERQHRSLEIHDQLDLRKVAIGRVPETETQQGPVVLYEACDSGIGWQRPCEF
jgi:hypothetical protein